MNAIRRTLCSMAVLAGALLPAFASADDLPGWLAGHWVMAGDRHVEEVWLAPRDGLMLGMSRTTGGGKPFFEFIRIEQRDDGVYYAAQPAGRSPPTLFRLVPASGDEVLFENPQHDFPQRVRYRRDGADAIEASIEGLQDGKQRVERWRYERLRADLP